MSDARHTADHRSTGLGLVTRILVCVYDDYFWFLEKGKEYCSGIGFLAQLVAGEVPGLEVELGSLLHAEHYLKLHR